MVLVAYVELQVTNSEFSDNGNGLVICETMIYVSFYFFLWLVLVGTNSDDN